MRKTPAMDTSTWTPWQRLRSLAAVEAIQRGEIRVALACGWCGSEGVTQVVDATEGQCLDCLACGRLTTIKTAHVLRKQKLRAIIVKGIEPELAGRRDA